MRTLNILSKHATMADAVKSAGIDLSYNERLALEDIKRMDSTKKYLSICVVEMDTKAASYDVASVSGNAIKVIYVYQADIKLLHIYNAFGSCIHCDPFKPVRIEEDKISIFNELPMSRSNESRKMIGKLDLIVTTA